MTVTAEPVSVLLFPLTPIAVCRRCGHQWASWAADRTPIRCPGCRYQFRLHRPVSGSDPATDTLAVVAVTTQVQRPDVLASVPADSSPVRNRKASRPHPPVAAVADTDVEDEPEYEQGITAAQIEAEGARVAAAIQRRHATGRPQRATGPPEMIQRLSAGVASISADFPYIRQRVEPSGIDALSRTIWIDQASLASSERRIASGEGRAADRPLMEVMLESAREPGTIVGAAVASSSEALRKNRAGRKQRDINACEYCGARSGINTQAVYRVRSPALDRERILCAKHTAHESAIRHDGKERTWLARSGGMPWRGRRYLLRSQACHRREGTGMLRTLSSRSVVSLNG